MCGTGSVILTRRDEESNRSKRTVSIKEAVLHSVEEQPSFNTKKCCSLIWYFALNTALNNKRTFFAFLLSYSLHFFSID